MRLSIRFVVILVGIAWLQFAQADSHSDSDLSYKRPDSFFDSLPIQVKNGSLNLKIGSDPKVMNPILSSDAESSSIEGYLWLPLMVMDPDTIQFLPALANSYNVSADKKDYTFYLNKNAIWQDNTPVTADDFKFTMDLIMNPKTNAAPLRSYLSEISLKVIDKTTIVFHTTEPRFDTLNILCGFVPIQKRQFDASIDFNKDKGIMQPVGNGPYVMAQYERGNKILFKRKKDWWGYSLPHFRARFNLDEINLKIIPDINLTYEKFIHGDLDLISFSGEQWETKVVKLDKEKFGLSRTSGKKNWALKIENKFPKPYSYIAWNEKNPIFDSVKTRTALSSLVNYKSILEKVFYNLSVQSSSPFGSFSDNSAPELRQPGQLITFDKKKAMALLKEDGWINNGQGNLVKLINGKEYKFIFNLNVPSQGIASIKIAQILKEDFKSFGIIMNIKSMEWNSFLDKIEKRDFDAMILAWTSTIFPNPKQIWHSKSQELGGSNFIGYSNPKVDDLIAKANLEFDIKKRQLIMQEINRLIYVDQPYTFLFESKYSLQGLNSKFQSPKWYSQYDGGVADDLFYLD